MDFTKIKKNAENELLINLDLLKSLYKVQAPSGKERQMINFIKNYVSKLNGVTCKQDRLGNLLITKGKLDEGEYFPCLIAHMDEVHPFNSNRIIVQAEDFIFAWDKKTGGRDGLGADDKNGIYVALEILQKVDKLKIFFSVGEEVGLVGTNGVDLKFFDDIGYMMQCDRKGSSDLIVFTNGITVTSDEFLYDVAEICDDYDYSEQYGVFTDVGGLKYRGVNVSGCNISCGYWDEHFEEELTHIPSLENCLNFVYKIIKSSGTKLYPHDYMMNEIKTKVDTFEEPNDSFDWDFGMHDPCYGCIDLCSQCRHR